MVEGRFPALGCGKAKMKAPSNPADPVPPARHTTRALKWLVTTALVVGFGALAFKAKRPKTIEWAGKLPPSSFLPTMENNNSAPGVAPTGMVWIPGGEFSMGSTIESEAMCGLPGITRDAQPIHRVYVDGFWMDETEVTNEQFEKFVQAAGYVSIAERTPTRKEFPTVPPENLVAGSTVFTPTAQPVPLENFYQWWRYEKAANWRHPEGPNSDLE